MSSKKKIDLSIPGPTTLTIETGDGYKLTLKTANYLSFELVCDGLSEEDLAGIEEWLRDIRGNVLQ